MSLLTRDAILAATDIAREVVSVPEWGGEVTISTMSGTQRDAWERSLLAPNNGGLDNARARLVAACAINSDGTLMFSPEDVVALGAKSSIALNRCAIVAQRLNLLTDKALEDAKGN